MSKVDPQIAAMLSEKLIKEFCINNQVDSPQDIAMVLEMLISKSARAIEKYNGTATARKVCDKTSYQLSVSPCEWHRS
ncbi:hypothetical protein [Pseudoalteromonas ruthenica]|uniref:hypothetical protein n=1 Tax=Pseudoalteromonas ruthenica TaxID=151081 RepID=UPI00110C1BEC|nr:hypothetical protein [Pseudoalteromonas ruthenica]TMP23760.1 hypothetical protein CWC06_09405 [Pseudoalteromonas ruthenica]